MPVARRGLRSSVQSGRNNSRYGGARRRRLAVEPLEPRWCMSLDVPPLSSLAGANHTIYLDFDGHVTEGTNWNSYFNNPSIHSPAYNTDGDATSYSTGELDDIRQAWQRIAEDFAPFAVNVTTVDPGLEALRKVGGSDTKWGVRVVITADTEASGAGGIAYVDSFNWSSDTPAFVYVTTGKYIAEAASHEAGHTLGLAHDGQGGSAYYYGHGSGATSWAPLMGVGYYSSVTQWDRGEYTGATNGGSGANYGKGPSDLAIITSYNGFGFKADDHGNTISQPTALANSAGAVSGSGIIGSGQDADVFAFITGAGNVTLNVSPAALGANLDVRADLLDAAGNLVTSSNPEGGLAAAISQTLPAGTYYLRIDGVGLGNPAASPPTGYTDYGSIGAYTISGQIVDAGSLATLAVGDASVSEAAGQASFTVTLSGTITQPVTVEYLTADDSARAGSDYSATTGTLTFQPGGPGQQIVTVPILADSASEPTERFFLRLQNPSAGAMFSDGQGDGTITDDDVSLSIGNLITREGTPRGKKAQRGIQLTLFIFTVSLSGPASGEVAVSYSTLSGTAAQDSDYFASSGTLTFMPGETSQSVLVNVIADSTAESDEGFQVVLSSAVGADLADAVAEGMIEDDDTRGGGNNLPSAIGAKSGQTTLPQPVRDVFAWQDNAGHEHDLSEHERPDETIARAALEFAALDLIHGSDQREQPLAIDEAFPSPALRRNWLAPPEPIAPAISWQIEFAPDSDKDPASIEEGSLDLLARDWIAQRNHIELARAYRL